MRTSGAFFLLGGLATGIIIGIGTYTFVYAKGYSYLTDNPSACANCHIMTEHYDGWVKSAHRSVAVCNDCHTPSGFFAKYANKAENGFRHSLAFTTGQFPEPIRIKDHNREITQAACRKCHQDIVGAIESPHHGNVRLSCLPCHSGAGHME